MVGGASTPSVADEMVVPSVIPAFCWLLCLLGIKLVCILSACFFKIIDFQYHVHLQVKESQEEKSQEEWVWALQASFPTTLSSLGSLHLLDKHTTPLCEVPAPFSTHVLPRCHHFFPNFWAGRLSGCLSSRSTPRGLLDKIKWSFLKAVNSTFNSRFSFTLLRQPSLSVALKFQLSAQLPSFAQLPSLGSVTV